MATTAATKAPVRAKAPARAKASAKEAPAPETVPETVMETVTADEAGIGQWEFLHRPPTRQQVIELLRSMKPVYGILYVDFADYVQALPQRKKVTRKTSTGRPNEIWFDSYAIYMSVPGRVAMLQAAAELNAWRAEFIPEPVTPTGVPGWLTNGKEEGRIVYREYLRIVPIGNDEDDGLGQKPGTAWVPYAGGSQAAGSNPYEKVETSARGRAIAAWGIGVLPGSGIASVEEIETAFQQKAEIDANGGRQQRGPAAAPARKTREELLELVHTTAEQYRQKADMDDVQIMRKLGEYCTNRLGVKGSYWMDDDEQWQLDLAPVKDGQLQLLINDLTTGLQRLEADAPL